MSLLDDDFRRQLLATFRVEAQEHLEVIGAGLVALEQAGADGIDEEQLASIFRAAHSLKGASRAVSLEEVEQICQELETVFAMLRDADIHPDAALFDGVHMALQCIELLLSGPGDGAEPECIQGAMNSLRAMVAGPSAEEIYALVDAARRGPVAALLYGVMLVSAVVLVFNYTQPWVGWLMLLMSLAVIGVHGMLSGTASMDFGGSKNVGIAVGLIDGFVYLGTAVMSFTYVFILPKEQLDAAGKIIGPATDPANWKAWPLSMVPLALIGLLLAWKIRDAKPKAKTTPAH